MSKRRTTVEQSQTLDEAWANYLAACRTLASIRQCDSDWPDDPRHPGYVGTRCDLLDGHEGHHRHRILGTITVVTW